MSEALQIFATQLLGATAARKVDWQWDHSKSHVTAVAPGGRVEIGPVQPPDVNPLRLSVFNTDGQTVDDIETDPEYPGPWRRWETELMALWEEARLSASGTHETLDKLREAWDIPESEPDDDIPF